MSTPTHHGIIYVLLSYATSFRILPDVRYSRLFSMGYWYLFRSWWLKVAFEKEHLRTSGEMLSTALLLKLTSRDYTQWTMSNFVKISCIENWLVCFQNSVRFDLYLAKEMEQLLNMLAHLLHSGLLICMIISPPESLRQPVYAQNRVELPSELFWSFSGSRS